MQLRVELVFALLPSVLEVGLKALDVDLALLLLVI